MATLLHGIPISAPVILDVGVPHRTTWGEFCIDNLESIQADAFDPSEVAATLLKRPGSTYRGGGGGSAEWTIRLLYDGETDYAR